MYLTVIHAKSSPEVVPGALILGVLAEPTIPCDTIFGSLGTMKGVDSGFDRCLMFKSLNRSPGFALLDQGPCHLQNGLDAWNCWATKSAMRWTSSKHHSQSRVTGVIVG